jgi:hypothetical protein
MSDPLTRTIANTRRPSRVTDPLTRTIILYALSILAGAIAAGLGVLATQLTSTDPIDWRPVIAAAIGPIVAGLAASRLPRPEGAALAMQIDALKAQGTPRHEMVVVSQAEAVSGVADPADPDVVRAVADELERRMKAQPAQPGRGA